MTNIEAHGKACEILAVLGEYDGFDHWLGGFSPEEQEAMIEELTAVVKSKE